MKLVSIALLVAGSCASRSMARLSTRVPALHQRRDSEASASRRSRAPRRGNSRFSPPPSVIRGIPAVIVPYPVFYGGYYGYYDPSTDASSSPRPPTLTATPFYGAPGNRRW